MGSILLTGAGGAVGSAVLRMLADRQVVSVAHRGGVPGRYVRGDITRPRLGLDRRGYRELVGSVRTVLHCAGGTDFGAGAETLYALNVTGTRTVARLAADAGARLIFASTAFVTRREQAAPVVRDYLDSKLAAEEVVRESGVPGAIARISIVIGDSVTGEMSRFQGLHATIDAVLRNLLPVLPFSPDAPVDVLPRDVVARALLDLADDGHARMGPGAVRWITAGAAALTVGRQLELVAGVGQRIGQTVSRPWLVRPALERLVRPMCIDPLPASRRRRFDNLMALASLFDGAGTFPSTLGPRAPGPEDLERAFAASVGYLAGIRGLGDLAGGAPPREVVTHQLS